jgi:hypothetical protein
MTKPIHDIQSAAVDEALQSLIAIRPDLDTKKNRALARMVAKEAVDNVLRGLREEGHLVPFVMPPTGAAQVTPNTPLPFDVVAKHFTGVIDSLGRMSMQETSGPSAPNRDPFLAIINLGTELVRQAGSTGKKD